ncbi:hypothetical protein PGB90_001716 [Kerria lacca]
MLVDERTGHIAAAGVLGFPLSKGDAQLVPCSGSGGALVLSNLQNGLLHTYCRIGGSVWLTGQEHHTGRQRNHVS